MSGTAAAEVQQHAHALRGTAANVGATRVADAATRLEHAARQADRQGMSEGLIHCHRAIETFIPIAEQWLASRPSTSLPKGAGVPLTPDAMAALKRKLRALQLDALDDVAQIVDWSAHLGVQGAAQLCESLQRLDFEGALHQLESLRLMHAT